MTSTKFTRDLLDKNQAIESESSKNIVQSSHAYLVLSLFFLLLAFFILLNAVSMPIEVRSQAVLASLVSTFRVIDDSSSPTENLRARLAESLEPEDLVKEMHQLWVTQFSLAEIEIFTDDRMIGLRLPVYAMFPAGAGLIRKDRLRLFTNIANVLKTDVPGYSNELELLVGAGWRVGEKLDFESSNLEIARAVNFAEILISSGAPSDTISIGIREGDSRELELRFFARRKASTGVEF